MTPILVRADRVTHCRRPRFYWISWALAVEWHYPLMPRGDHLELLLPNDPGPRRRWLSLDAAWKAQGADARLPSFLRARPSKRQPFKPTGIDSCNPLTVHRWEKASALEKERLLDFALRHTLTCMPTRALSQNA